MIFNTRKMQEKIITLTDARRNGLYYVQNFRIIGWFGNPAAINIEPFVTNANVIVTKSSILAETEFLYLLLRTLEL